MTRIHGRILSVLLITVCLFLGAFYERGKSGSVQKARDTVDTQTDPGRINSLFTDVAVMVQKSVLGVNNYQSPRALSGRGQLEEYEPPVSSGSGVVVFREYVLTNYHVVEGAGRITVFVTGEEKERAATLAAYDPSVDIAVLHVKGLDAAPASLGDSDQVQVGEWTVCIGNPLNEDLRGTVTAGIVSALDREVVSYEAADQYGLHRKTVNKMIQTDAAINSGNSGGGLFNVLGQLVGIPTMKYTGNRFSGASVEGIALAVPINSAKGMIQRAIGDRLTDESVNFGE